MYISGGSGGSGGTAVDSVAVVATSNQAFRVGNLDISQGITQALSFFTSNQERMRITSNGWVGIGTQNPTQMLHVEGQIYSLDDITAFSDCNYKHEILPIDDALGKLARVGGYTFTYDHCAARRRAGLLAQEVQNVLPEVVSTDPDGKLSVAYGNFSALLVNAIKELKHEVDQIKERLDM